MLQNLQDWYIIWPKRDGCKLSISPSFSDRSRDVAMTTNFGGQIGEIGLAYHAGLLDFWKGLHDHNANKHINTGVHV